MKRLLSVLLLFVLFLPVFAVYTPGNGVCERDGGENCFVSPDCYPCRIEIRGVNIAKNGEVYRIGFEVCNFENRRKEFLITASENSETLLHVTEEIPAESCKTFKFYSVLAQAVIIRVGDPEKEIIYAFKEIAPKEVKERETAGAFIFNLSRKELLVLFGFPTLILVLFFLVIFFPRKKKLKEDIIIHYVPKAPEAKEVPPPAPVERYAMPLHYFPEWHGSYAPTVEVAQIVVVPKRKVYYLRKKEDKG